MEPHSFLWYVSRILGISIPGTLLFIFLFGKMMDGRIRFLDFLLCATVIAAAGQPFIAHLNTRALVDLGGWVYSGLVLVNVVVWAVTIVVAVWLWSTLPDAWTSWRAKWRKTTSM